MVQVLCLTNFFDVEAKIIRQVGDKWSVTKARANAILNAETKGLIEILSMEAEPKPKAKLKRGKA
jgi:hypothetical protein